MITPLANSLNIMAIFYRYSPNSSEFQAIIEFFKQDEWLDQWLELDENSNEKLSGLKLNQLDKLEENGWTEYFGLEQTLVTPPWGSVYLDEEGLLNGESTLAWKKALKQAGVTTHITNEPLDHIGLSLMALATISVNNEELALRLFNIHISKWVFKYLNQLEQQCDNIYILDVIQLTQMSLAGLINT